MSSTKAHEEIRAVMILEILGRPKEHLVETLTALIDKMNSENGITVENKKINEPSLIKDQKDIYTTYAEVELKAEDPFSLIVLVFKYMPSHIEMISPEEFVFKNTDYNDLLNEIARRMHAYDELSKILQMNQINLENQLKGILEKHPEILEELKKVQETEKKIEQKEIKKIKKEKKK